MEQQKRPGPEGPDGAVRLACPEDIDAWMRLVDRVRADFPGLETDDAMAEHRAAVLRFIGESSAVCAVRGSRLAGALLFSKENSMLCFLAVDPACRRQHIARKMVAFMLTRMEAGRDVTVTTYREGDPRGVAARAFYKQMGFSEGEPGEEFGCPVQEFILKGRAAGQM